MSTTETIYRLVNWTKCLVNTEIKSAFGHRLKDIRSSLAYTQEEMAHALGISGARYSKYEIGRSEAPYEVLIRLAHLTGTDLNYLIAGQRGRAGRRPEPVKEQLRDLLKTLPVPALVYDKRDCLAVHNEHYIATFFPEHPKLARIGTPLEKLIRLWAYSRGFDPLETEQFIRFRLDRDLYRDGSVPLQIGQTTLQYSETIDASTRLVLIIDVTQFKTCP